MGFGKRAGDAATDPWLLMAAVFGGGVAWAVALPAGAALAVGAGMYGAGVAIGGLLNRKDGESKEPPLPGLVKGTAQAGMVANLQAYVVDLRKLRSDPKPDAVVDASIEALVAAENAQSAAVRVAAAIDGLDSALARSGPPSNNTEVRASVQRMLDRRAALLGKLQATVDEVAEVYTKLLETSATVGSLDVGQGADAEVAKVNDSLDSLRASLAELEKQPEV